MTGSNEIERFLSSRRPEADACGRLAVGSVLDGWKVVAFVGAGRSAEVYRVINQRIGGDAALKLLIDDSLGLRERFRLEVDVLRALAIPALPRFFGEGQVDGRPFYVMEYLQPLILPLPRTEILPFMTALAASVEALHAAGYVHRDIKPANILRRRSGEPVLIDLGLVKRIGAGGATVSDGLSLVDGKRIGVGTPDFAAPEQLIKGEATVRSDVFALGKMLKACGGKSLGPAVRRVIRHATAEDPEDRHPDVATFSAALRRVGRFRMRSVCAACAACAVFLAVAGAAIVRFQGPLRWPPAVRPPVSLPVPPLVAPPALEAESLLREPGESEVDYLARLLVRARAGDGEAQCKAAEAYFYGRGAATNLTESVRLYQAAAKGGHPGAQASLGHCFLHGFGCERNEGKAADWFLSAAKAGNLGAMTDLAYCFRNGVGVDRDDREAFAWAMKAAVSGHPDGQAFVGECYMFGYGVPVDSRLADVWLQRAARQGHERAKMLLRNP